MSVWVRFQASGLGQPLGPWLRPAGAPWGRQLGSLRWLGVPEVV